MRWVYLTVKLQRERLVNLEVRHGKLLLGG
jgi:hypothetical protein